MIRAAAEVVTGHIFAENIFVDLHKPRESSMREGISVALKTLVIILKCKMLYGASSWPSLKATTKTGGGFVNRAFRAAMIIANLIPTEQSRRSSL
jgi:hypothetical protein